MTLRPNLCAVSFLSCLLTLAASGDDFCVVRAFLACPPAAEELLPLDDPNTDFVESGDVSSQSGSGAGHHTGGRGLRDDACLTSTAHTLLLGPAPAGDGYWLRANLNVPLVC